jgi:hypothetical protein
MHALLLGHTATQAMMWSSPVAQGFSFFFHIALGLSSE